MPVRHRHKLGMKTEAAKFPVSFYNVFERGALHCTVLMCIYDVDVHFFEITITQFIDESRTVWPAFSSLQCYKCISGVLK